MFVSLSSWIIGERNGHSAAGNADARRYNQTFTSNGVVDEETQRNDLAVVKDVAQVTTDIPIQKTYDFSFAHQANNNSTKRAGSRETASGNRYAGG
jgi:hypothetical protein